MHAGTRRRLPALRPGLSPRRQLAGAVTGLVVLPLLTLGLTQLPDILSLPSHMLLYLIVVVAVALVGGLFPALAAAVAASALLDYYFIPPIHSFAMGELNNEVALVAFLLFAGAVSSVAGLAAHRTREAEAFAIANAENRSELAASRARIVATADETRRRIERDLHDGTQQRLVSLSLELRLAQSTVPPDLPELRIEIGRVADEVNGVIDELREIARGIHPAILSTSGLGPALRTLARRSTIPVEVDVRAVARFRDPVEVAAYYVVSEALTNTTKHARASCAHVALEEGDNVLHLSISDDGVGGADPARGSGLVGLRDRVEALGGSIEAHSHSGEGTLILVELPLQPC